MFSLPSYSPPAGVTELEDLAGLLHCQEEGKQSKNMKEVSEADVCFCVWPLIL